MTTIAKTSRPARKPAIAQAMEKASAAALAKANEAKADEAKSDEAKARQKSREKLLKVAAVAASRPIMEGAAIANHELEESAKLAGKAKVTWYDAIVHAFKAKAWQGMTAADYETFARKVIADGVASAFRSQPQGNWKVYRAEAKVIALAAANGLSSKGKSYNERVQALRDACKAKGLLGEHKNDKPVDKRAPRPGGNNKETGHKADAKQASEAHAKAGEVKTFDRPLTERMLAMTPIGEYAAFLVSVCLDEAPKVRAWLDTLKD